MKKRMKKRLSIVIVILLCLSVLAGCASAQGNQQNAGPGSSLDENVSNAYEKLVSYKVDGYAEKSVKDFDTLLMPEFEELLNAQAIVTAVGLSDEDENYDFITVTLDASLQELYAEQMDDEMIYFGYVRKERFSEPLDEVEKAIFAIEGPAYDFWFNADYTLKYEVLSPDTLKVAERDNVLRTFGKMLQAYVDSLSEEELTDSAIDKNLSERAETILKELAPDGMEISYKIEIWNDGECIMPTTSFSDKEYQKLLALQLDGYEDMSVSEFQNNIWILTDSDEYRDLLNRFSKNIIFYEQKDCDETASFYFYVLEPLTAENWYSRSFDNLVMTDYPSSYDQAILTDFPLPADQAVLEYTITLTITNADTLTVGEYINTRIEINKTLQGLMNSKTAAELQNEAEMSKVIDSEIERIQQRYNTDAIKVSIGYSFMPLENCENNYKSVTSVINELEIREIEYGTKADYDSLLALMTPDYANMSVADFNLKLLDWAEEEYERMERVNGDLGWNDYQVHLGEDELSFVELTVYLSGEENGKYVQSQYTGRPESDPVYNVYLPQRLVSYESRQTVWCDLYYQFSYHITDKETLTVGERDHCVESVVNGIQDFWNGASIDDLLEMTEIEVVKELQNIAAKYSNDQIAITIRENQVHMDCS